MTIYGSVWDTKLIDSEPPLKVSKDLLPWLLKDRKQAEEGATFYNSATGKDEHDRQGVQYAERELRRIKADLATEKSPDTNRAVILAHQARGQQEQVDFWRGKIYLLDKTIASLR